MASTQKPKWVESPIVWEARISMENHAYSLCHRSDEMLDVKTHNLVIQYREWNDLRLEFCEESCAIQMDLEGLLFFFFSWRILIAEAEHVWLEKRRNFHLVFVIEAFKSILNYYGNFISFRSSQSAMIWWNERQMCTSLEEKNCFSFS